MKEQIETCDLTYILYLLRRRIVWIILAIVLGGVLLFSYANFFVAPEYTAKITFLVSNKNDSNNNVNPGTQGEITQQQVLASQSLIKTYADLMKDTSVTGIISDRMNGEYSEKDLDTMITTSYGDTMLLDVSVTAKDPEDARDICNYLDEAITAKSNEFAEFCYIGYIGSLEAAEVPERPSAPNVQRYAMIGALLGLLVSCAFIIVVGLMDNTIKSEEEMKERFDVPMLGKIPSFESVSGSDKKGY